MKVAGGQTSFHTDAYHQGTGTTIGSNIEVTKYTSDGAAIGINIQSKGFPTERGINFQSSFPNKDVPTDHESRSRWKTGIHFDEISEGDKAIQIEGKWDVGIDTGHSDIRMNKDAKLILGESMNGPVYITFNSATKAIELHQGSIVLGTFPLALS
jgi:hypothetical protein